MTILPMSDLTCLAAISNKITTRTGLKFLCWVLTIIACRRAGCLLQRISCWQWTWCSVPNCWWWQWWHDSGRNTNLFVSFFPMSALACLAAIRNKPTTRTQLKFMYRITKTASRGSGRRGLGIFCCVVVSLFEWEDSYTYLPNKVSLSNPTYT
jgi:hypothetical protein